VTYPSRVEDYLEHIAEAITHATGYLQHIDNFAAFEDDQRNQDAVVRNVEIIGEAANKIQKLAPDFIAEHPELPWAQMRAMRNLVIHEYFFLDLKIVSSTVKDDLPQVKKKVDDLLTGLHGHHGPAA
jgi:uncharacterized protein with HEPN domain